VLADEFQRFLLWVYVRGDCEILQVLFNGIVVNFFVLFCVLCRLAFIVKGLGLGFITEAEKLVALDWDEKEETHIIWFESLCFLDLDSFGLIRLKNDKINKIERK